MNSLLISSFDSISRIVMMHGSFDGYTMEKMSSIITPIVAAALRFVTEMGM
ncbi:MAG: hypothetical protein WCL14_00530 [Bacteroidota bacterium]